MSKASRTAWRRAHRRKETKDAMAELAPEPELEKASVTWDDAAPSYVGAPVIKAEDLQTPEEAAESARALHHRDAPSTLRTVLALNVGVILCALAFAVFQSPNHFAVGGASGLSIVFSTLVPGLSQTLALWIVNVALVVVGLVFVERKRVFWSVVASIALSAYASLFKWLLPLLLPTYGIGKISPTGDMWLDLCCMVLLVAAGNAIAYNAGASTGGTEILVMVLARRTSLEVTHAVTLVNLATVITAVVLYGPHVGLYCVLGLVIQTVVVGAVLNDLKQHKICTIICKQPARVEEFIVRELGRTATVYHAYGAYSGKEMPVVVTVLQRKEALQLKLFLKELDPNAFVTYATTSQIMGRGFRWV